MPLVDRLDRNHVATVSACVAFLAIAALAIARSRREPIASRFGALCLVLFTYTAFELASELSAAPAWLWLDTAAATMCAPVFYHFVMTFLGQRRRRRPSIVAFYVYFGLVGAACLSPIFVSSMRPFPNGRVWAALVVAGLLATCVIGVTRLVLHARRELAAERARVALVLGAVLVTAGGAATDLVGIAWGSRAIRISTWAMFAGAVLLGFAAFRTRVLERVSWLGGLTALSVAVAVVLGEVALFRWTGDQPALLALGSVLIALGALLAGRFLLAAAADARSRLREQAARGRMSSQLAHDLRNPLQTVKLAAQVLEGEIESGKLRGDASHAAWLTKIRENADRIAGRLQRYERMARVEPELREVDVNALVRAAVASVPADPAVEVTCSFARSAPRCMADPELVTAAVENVVRNAKEALEKGGLVRVATGSNEDFAVVEVADDGPGMTPIVQENVFDDFYTTKPTGSGLGLAFVKRVMEAHRGAVRLDSVEGKGTTVTLELPLYRPFDSR